MTHYIIYYTQDDLNSVPPDPKILNPDPWNPIIILYLIQGSAILDHVFEKKSVTKTGPDPPQCKKCYTFFR